MRNNVIIRPLYAYSNCIEAFGVVSVRSRVMV